MSSSRPFLQKLILGLLVLSALLLAWSLYVEVSGGVHLRVSGLRISSRAPLRPFLAGLLLGGVAVFLARRYRVDPYGVRDAWPRLASTIESSAASRAPYVVGAAALAVVVLGTVKGSRAASGSDAYGYVSQAMLWLDGDLLIEQPFAIDPIWPSGQWTFSPLGYRPSPLRDGIVPTYAPGVPLIMAALMLAFGACGPYLLTPISAGAVVFLTYRLGLLVSTPIAAAIAALLVAASPTTLFMVMWPMSDLPVAACWILALTLSASFEKPHAVPAGLATGLAILIRPNLAPLALVPAAILVWRGGGTLVQVGLRLVRFGLAVLPFVIGVAAVNAWLYGGPTNSGYGALESIYQLDRIPANFWNYTSWLRQSQTALVFLFLLGIVLRSRRDARLPVAALWAFIGMLFACYLPYEIFHDWWYLRFLLPALPLVFLIGADVVYRMSMGLSQPLRVAVCAIYAAVMIHHAVGFAAAHDFLKLGEGEERYAAMGVYLRDALPPNALVIAMQHSGSVRHYAGVTTIRYDSMDAAALEAVVKQMHAAGMHPFAVLDDWEDESLRETATEPVRAIFSRGPIAIVNTPTRVRLYDLAPAPQSASAPVYVPRLPRWSCPPAAPRRPFPAGGNGPAIRP